MQLLTSAPFQNPKAIISYFNSILSQPSPTFWYDFSIGTRHKTGYDLSGNSYSGSSFSPSAQLDSAWEASTYGGMLHLDNSSSSGGYVFRGPDVSFSSGDGFVHMGFLYQSMNSTFNVIIGGNYSPASKYWRVGISTSGFLHIAANGSQYAFNSQLLSGRRYILSVRFQYTGGNTSGFGVATLRDHLGNVYSTGFNTNTQVSSTRQIGIGTYGLSNYGSYTPNIKVGHVLAYTSELGSNGDVIETLLNAYYSRKYQFNLSAGGLEPQNIYSGNASFPINITFQGTTAADADTPYSVLEKRINVTSSGSSATGRLYIGVRNYASTTFYGDLAISHLQIINPSNPLSFAFRTGTISGATRAYDFNFHNSTLGYSLFATTTAASQTSISTNPSTYSYSTVSTAATVNRFSAGFSTGSSYTGANNGTYTSTYSGLGVNTTTGGSFLKVGSHSQPQGSSVRFLFPESSGMTRYHITWLRSPQLTVHNGDIIRLAYLATSPVSSAGLRQTGTLYFRWV